MPANKKPPRRHQRRVYCNPIQLAINRASKMTATERNTVLAPLRSAAVALREGRGQLRDWQLLAGAMNEAIAVEDGKVITGLRNMITNAQIKLRAIADRAETSGQWETPTLYAEEIKAIQDAIWVATTQLQNLSIGEALNAMTLAQARVRAEGGTIVHIDDARP